MSTKHCRYCGGYLTSGGRCRKSACPGSWRPTPAPAAAVPTMSPPPPATSTIPAATTRPDRLDDASAWEEAVRRLEEELAPGPAPAASDALRADVERRLNVVQLRIDGYAHGCSRTNARYDLRFARDSLSSADKFLAGDLDYTAPSAFGIEDWRRQMADECIEEAAHFATNAERAAGILARPHELRPGDRIVNEGVAVTVVTVASADTFTQLVVSDAIGAQEPVVIDRHEVVRRLVPESEAVV